MCTPPRVCVRRERARRLPLIPPRPSFGSWTCRTLAFGPLRFFMIRRGMRHHLRNSSDLFFSLFSPPPPTAAPWQQPVEALMPLLQKPPKGKGLAAALEYVRHPRRPVFIPPLLNNKKERQLYFFPQNPSPRLSHSHTRAPTRTHATQVKAVGMAVYMAGRPYTAVAVACSCTHSSKALW
jgi:hypothetical protein